MKALGLTVSIDVNKQKCEVAINKNEIESFQHVLVNEDIRSKYSNVTQPIPSQILINRNGVVIWNSMDQSTSLESILKKEFGE